MNENEKIILIETPKEKTEDKPKKKSSREGRTNTGKKYNKTKDLIEKPKKRVPPLHEALKTTRLAYNDDMSYETVIKLLIDATGEVFHSDQWVANEKEIIPVDKGSISDKEWEENYTKYFYFNEKDSHYVRYTKITEKVEIIKDGVMVTETIEHAPKMESTVFKKSDRASSVITKEKRGRWEYLKPLHNFVKDTYEKYCKEFQNGKRELYIKMIIEGINRYIRMGTIPDFDELYHWAVFGESERFEAIVNTVTSSHRMLSYNQKVAIAKDLNPKNKSETDSEYESRIKDIVMSGKWECPVPYKGKGVK